MSALVAGTAHVAQRAPQPAPDPEPRLVLLGTGTVGSAFVRRHARLQGQLPLPPLVRIANSRAVRDCAGDPAAALALAVRAPPRAGAWAITALEPLRRGDIVVDATASDAVAARHAPWLRRGIHVVTANKLGLGAGCGRAARIARALRAGGAHYGDAATVGAGLPLLRTIRGLVQGGDRIVRVEGVLSGSMAWLFEHFDGRQPFSRLVREARAAGYTEPDPRVDLSGEDVRRKLLILARAAGLRVAPDAVRVESLVPASLAAASRAQLDERLPDLDAALAQHQRQARGHRARLCFVAQVCVEPSGAVAAGVGLRALPPGHPLHGGRGTDNRLAITTERYGSRPLLVQGPGAGAEVTAAALLDEVAAIRAADQALARAAANWSSGWGRSIA